MPGSLFFVFRKPLAERVVQKRLLPMMRNRIPSVIVEMQSGNCKPQNKGGLSRMNDTNSLAHMKWNCIYHFVCASKCRRKVFFGEKCKDSVSNSVPGEQDTPDQDPKAAKLAVLTPGPGMFVNVRNAPRVVIPPPSESPLFRRVCRCVRSFSVYPFSSAKANVGRL